MPQVMQLAQDTVHLLLRGGRGTETAICQVRNSIREVQQGTMRTPRQEGVGQKPESSRSGGKQECGLGGWQGAGLRLPGQGQGGRRVGGS